MHASNRDRVNGILCVLKTGARWRDLHPEYPSGSSCWGRPRQWEDEGIWSKACRQTLAA
jgi:transposase